jgi:hypothetical protein
LIQINECQPVTDFICAAAEGAEQEEAMIRVVAIAFVLTLTSSAQAIPIASLHHTGDVVTTVRELCGVGRHMVGGRCIATPARRTARRCAAGVTCY